MNDNIHALAKVIAESDPDSGKSLWKAVKEAGYTGAPQQLVREVSAALLAVWDGKASTLDQAAAWRKVRDYLDNAGLLPRPSLRPGNSDLDQVLNCIGELRRNSAMAMTTSINVDLGSWDPAALERLLNDVREYPSRCVRPVSGTLRRPQALHGSSLVWMTPAERIRKSSEVGNCLHHADYAHLEGLVNAWRAANPSLAASWGWLQCPGHAVSPKSPKAIGMMIDKRGRDKPEDYEFQSIVGSTEEKWLVVDMDGTIRHPHCKAWAMEMYPQAWKKTGPLTALDFPSMEREDGHVLYKDGDADAPEQLKDGNGEIVLAQCRNCGKAEIELDGSRCTSIPANDNSPLGLPGLTEHQAAALNKLRAVVEPARLDVMRRLLVLQDTCYGLAEQAGWWKDLETGEDVRSWPKKHFDNYISAKLMLMVTELAEAMEGHRKGLMDDKLPHRPMLEVELADCVIRIMDTAGALNLDVGGAIVEKLAYNMTREDHQIENRKAAGGKSV